MDYLLDTTAIIEIENNNVNIINKINKLKSIDGDTFYISIFSFCEYYRGVINKSDKNKANALERLNKYLLLNTTRKTGILFVELLHHLSTKGQTIPHFDLFIASIAQEHNLTIITSDAHFKRIPEIKVVLI